MAKESGLGWTTASVDDSGDVVRNLVNDMNSVRWSIPRNTQEVTGLDKSAIERLVLLADFSLTMDGTFNDAANTAHDVFKTVASADAIRDTQFVISGQTLNNKVWLTDYQLTRASEGSFTWSVPAELQDGTVPTWS